MTSKAGGVLSFVQLGGWRKRFFAVAAGLIVDLALGEPPIDPHPVSVYGSAMRSIEDALWADDRSRGVAHAAAGIALAGVAGVTVRSTALATAVAVAGNALATEARAVGDRLNANDIAGARERLPSLVGRDPANLNGVDMARAVVESVAENSVDAVVATALWAAALGPVGAFVHRGVNTLDAMVGHRTHRHLRYGWASARVDDAMAWVPARIAAALVAGVRPGRALVVARVVRRDGASHPSPNGGVIEAAFAAALGVQLGGGHNDYGEVVETRPTLGDGRPPEAGDIERAAVLLRDMTLLLATLLCIAAIVPAPRRRRAP